MNIIKLQNLTPKVYYTQSRDFQFIGRLFDVVLNSVKTNTDLISNLPLTPSTESRLVDLLATTLGFKSKHNYNLSQLVALCSSFVEVLRLKGSIDSIKLACNLLLQAEGITSAARVEKDGYTVKIYVSTALSDLNLLKDLLNYILPAGMSCQIIKELSASQSANTEIRYLEDSVKIYKTDGAYGSLDASKSIIPQISQEGLTDKLAKDTPGLFVNSNIIRPVEPNSNSKEID